MSLILVTGSSTGLGLNAAAELADQGHQVVVHARTAESEPAAPSGREWRAVLLGDLTDQSQTRSVAEQANAVGRFDAVIHNAGVVSGPDTVAVNVIAPYLLTALMTSPDRLIYLSSGMHRNGSADLSGLTSGRARYSDTKLWLTALALALANRWPQVASHAVDPGWVPTRMGGSNAPDDLIEGHRTQTWLATASRVDPPTGGYWFHRRTYAPHPSVTDPEFQGVLLDALAKQTGVPCA